MRLRAYLIFPMPLIFLAALFSLAPLAHAESTVWDTTVPQILFLRQDIYQGELNQCSTGIQNPNVSVSYNVRAINTATGENVCNSTIPAGTKIRFSFIPHVAQDISWFATGFNFDSPYGDWSPGAAETTDQSAWCADSNYISSFGIGNRTYVMLEVNPPAQSVTNTGRLSCGQPDSDGSVTCTAPTAATAAPEFTFGNTYGHFYFAVVYVPGSTYPYPNTCVNYGFLQSIASPTFGDVHGTPAASCTPNDPNGLPYKLDVPAQQISCPITVTASQPGNAPSTPVVSATGATGAGGSAACMTGTPYSISMSATSPQGDQLRYLIDWNADGMVDEIVPATGYVPSGTTETASRTYSIAGSKTVKVAAEDTNGLTSGWATLSFDCAPGADQSQQSNLNGNLGNGDNGAGTPSPDLSLRVIPSLVASGATTKVNWSATNVKSCTVTGQNGDSWTGLQSILGGNISKPITQTTQYTLTCLSLSGNPLKQTATVTILPTFQEQ